MFLVYDVAISLLLFKVDKHYWPVLKACLDYLGYLYPHELNDVEIDSNVEGNAKRTMSRAIDLIITYRVVKMLVTPFNKFKAFDLGIIDEKGKVLRKFKEVKGSERKHYTMLHRFVFNLKRILTKVGLGSRLGSFAVALALLIKEDKSYAQHKDNIEAAVITYLKEENLYNMLLNEVREIPEIQQPYMTCFGIDVYEREEELIAEDEYAKTL